MRLAAESLQGLRRAPRRQGQFPGGPQTLPLPLLRGTQQLPGQSSSVAQSWKHEKLVPSCSKVTQVVPLQQGGVSSPAQAAPALPQLQNLASTQKPSVLFEKGLQQPVSKQSSFFVQRGRQPA
jgi:hypothetical protein